MRTSTFVSALWLMSLICLPSQSTYAGHHSGVTSLVAGSDAVETCALMADKRLSCWGDGVATPHVVDVGGQDVVAASIGYHFRCAIARFGAVYCWGVNPAGQLGDGSTAGHDNPAPVKFATGVFGPAVSIAAGYQHACGVLADTSIWCWGDNGNGQIGNFAIGVGKDALTPAQVIVNDPMGSPPNPPLLQLKSVTVGYAHSCALFNDNSAACWGGDYEGELGDGRVRIDHDDSPKTVVVPDDTGKLVALIFGGGQLAAGQYHTCGLISSSPSSSVGCWGANGHGQLGDNTLSVRSIAVAANDEAGPITNAIALSAGYATTCALLTDTTPRCWGSDEDNELGRGAAGSNQFTGITITNTDGFPLGGIVDLVSGAWHSCALSVDKNVYCWGINSAYELGPNASGSNSDLPVVVPIDAPIFFDNLEGD